MSFPGGRIDPGDASPEAAALREAQEEIGLDPARVEVVGRLGDYVTGTGYRITPVLGLLPAGSGWTGWTWCPRRTRWRRCSSCRWPCCSTRRRRNGGGAEYRGPLARVLGLAASGALHLGRDRGYPGAVWPPCCAGM